MTGAAVFIRGGLKTSHPLTRRLANGWSHLLSGQIVRRLVLLRSVVLRLPSWRRGPFLASHPHRVTPNLSQEALRQRLVRSLSTPRELLPLALSNQDKSVPHADR